MEESIKLFCVTPIRRLISFGEEGVESIARHNLVEFKELLGEKIDCWKILISSHRFFYDLLPLRSFGLWLFKAGRLSFLLSLALRLKTINMGNSVPFFPTINILPVGFWLLSSFSDSCFYFLSRFIAVTWGRMGLVGATWCY